MKTTLLKGALAVLMLFAAACSDMNLDEINTDLSTEIAAGQTLNETLAPPVCASTTFPLTAGKHIDAGNVIVSNDNENLYITVNSTAGFAAVAENVKIWVGTNTDLTPAEGGVPVNGQGVPIAGQFPWKYNASDTTITVTIPFTELEAYNGVVNCSSKILVYVHVDVLGGETAWGGALPGNLNTNRWYFYDTYQAVCCTPPPPPSGYTQTAFAKGNYVFTTDKKSNPERLPSLGLTRNRWGWAINVTTAGVTTYDIYAGAGLNNTSKGTKVGTLTVNWDGTNATVTYNLLSGFTTSGVHVYAGDNRPTTIAPGQYGNTASFDPNVSTYSNTYAVSDSGTDGIWIIAHAGVYGNY